jgi:hypothetical protein
LVLVFYACLLIAANFPALHHHSQEGVTATSAGQPQGAENHGNKANQDDHCFLCAWQAMAQEELDFTPVMVPILLGTTAALPFYRATHPLVEEAGLNPTRGPPLPLSA